MQTQTIQLRKTVLAFLCERYPAAYTAKSITQRVNRSGLLDVEVTDAQVLAELRLLVQRFQYIVLLVDEDGEQHWGASTGGVIHWQLDGALSVGG